MSISWFPMTVNSAGMFGRLKNCFDIPFCERLCRVPEKLHEQQGKLGSLCIQSSSGYSTRSLERLVKGRSNDSTALLK